MSISGILSSSFSQNQLSGASTLYQPELQQLGKDLQSSNLSAAQSDFAALQKAFSQPPAGSAVIASPFSSTASTSNPAIQAFNQLAADLQSGNLAAAQKDFSTVEQDLQSANGTQATSHFHHHHHLSGGGGSGGSTNQTSLLQDLNQVGQSLTSGNLSGAQRAYATLQQQLQPFTLGRGTLSTQLPVSIEA